MDPQIRLRVSTETKPAKNFLHWSRNDLIDEKCFHDHQNEKAVFKFDLFSNLVDICSDLFDDDMFVKSFAALMFQAIKCNCLP